MMRRVLTALVVAAFLTAGIATSYAAPQTQAQTKEDDFLKGVFQKETPGLTMPKVKYNVHPKYTSDAMRAKIQGEVEVQAVVRPDGTVARSRVVSSLDRAFGLDDEALKAVNQWTFEPGTLQGRAVPVAVNLTMQFRLH